MPTIFSESFDEYGCLRQGGSRGSSQALRTDRPVPAGRHAGAAESRHDRFKRLILAYGSARQIHGSGEAVRRAWESCMRELGDIKDHTGENQ